MTPWQETLLTICACFCGLGLIRSAGRAVFVIGHEINNELKRKRR